LCDVVWVTTTTNWEALAAAARDRRTELGMRQQDVAKNGGPSHESVRQIEGALRDSYRRRTLVQLEQVLRWRQGTVDRILDGTAGDDPAAWDVNHDGRAGAAPAETMESRRYPDEPPHRTTLILGRAYQELLALPELRQYERVAADGVYKLMGEVIQAAARGDDGATASEQAAARRVPADVADLLGTAPKGEEPPGPRWPAREDVPEEARRT
jgi:hypothetical protein